MRLSSSDLPVLWICGAAGSGKSATAWSLFEKAAPDGLTVGYLDIDQLGMLYPDSPDDPWAFQLKTQALGALVPNYLAAGAQALIVSGVLDSHASAEAARGLPGARLTFCLLDPGEAALRERLLLRGCDADDAEEAVAEHRTLATAAFLDHSIDTVGMTIDEVSDRIRPLLSVLEPRRPDQGLVAASPSRADLVVLTGGRVVGTSTVGFGLASSLWSAGVTAGFADLDQLSFIRGNLDPQVSRTLAVANLAALHALFGARGAARLILTAHLRDERDHQKVRAAAPRGRVMIIRLRAEREALAAHAVERTTGSEARLAGDDLVCAPPARVAEVVERAWSEQQHLDSRSDEDAVVDVTGRDVDAVVQEVADLLQVHARRSPGRQHS